jgi:hypothetical protein
MILVPVAKVLLGWWPQWQWLGLQAACSYLPATVYLLHYVLVKCRSPHLLLSHLAHASVEFQTEHSILFWQQADKRASHMPERALQAPYNPNPAQFTTMVEGSTPTTWLPLLPPHHCVSPIVRNPLLLPWNAAHHMSIAVFSAVAAPGMVVIKMFSPVLQGRGAQLQPLGEPIRRARYNSMPFWEHVNCLSMLQYAQEVLQSNVACSAISCTESLHTGLVTHPNAMVCANPG